MSAESLLNLFIYTTKTGYRNLLNEGFKENQPPYSMDHPAILNYGDIMYDNSLFFSGLAEQKSGIIKKLNLENKNFVLATVHRDYNTDKEENLINIIKAFNHISQEHQTHIV